MTIAAGPETGSAFRSPIQSGRAQGALFLTALAAGVALGVASRLGDELPGGIATVANIGGPWLIMAFALGAMAGRPRLGAGLGATGLVIANGAYYGYIEVVQHGAGRVHLLATALLWIGVGFVSGAGFGLVGSWWRSRWPRDRALATALLTGALVGEALVLLRSQWMPGGEVVLALELIAGLGLPWALLRREQRSARAMAEGMGVALVPVAMVVTAGLLALAARLAA